MTGSFNLIGGSFLDYLKTQLACLMNLQAQAIGHAIGAGEAVLDLPSV